MRFNELTEEPGREDGSLPIIKAFVDFACDRIGLERPPQIKLVRNPKLASQRRSFGGYMPGGGIEITIGNRHIMDVLRTLAHELVHHKQDVDGRLNDESGKDGSEHENEANAKAAVVMRLWGKMNPELFQKAALLAESWIRESNSILEEGTIEERRKKKRRVRNAAYGPGPYGWYGYDAGYSGDGGGGGDGGESMREDSNNKEAILRIQKMLNDKYNANLDLDGVLGPLTRKSINKFMPNANVGLADEPNKTTAVQGNKIKENFADGRNPQDKGDSKRHGVPTKASVSTLRKVAKQGGRKGELAHWMANMKAGKAKNK